MRIMTYNIWDGGAARASLIADVIASVNPDVVLLNEADDERVVESLARRLAYEPLWARGSGDKHVALLSRLPIGEWQIYNRRPITQAVLAVTVQCPKPALSGVEGSNVPSQTLKSQTPTSNFQLPTANFQPPIANLQLFGVHLMPYFMLLPYEFARWRTVRALLRLVRQAVPGPHLILGDFNAALRGERTDTSAFSTRMRAQLWLQANRQPRFALSQIPHAGYADCYRRLHPHDDGLTWMPWALSARLDYIFADPQMAQRLQHCDVVTTPAAARASDHFPLVAEFDV